MHDPSIRVAETVLYKISVSHYNIYKPINIKPLCFYYISKPHFTYSWARFYKLSKIHYIRKTTINEHAISQYGVNLNPYLLPLYRYLPYHIIYVITSSLCLIYNWKYIVFLTSIFLFGNLLFRPGNMFFIYKIRIFYAF